MPANAQHPNGTDGGDICVATQQKAIYSWYQSRHSDDEVVDIYSSRWQERIMEWYTWHVNNLGSVKASTLTVQSWRTLDELDLRILFFAHPVAAFALWHVLQAFYAIDEAVCGTASDAPAALAQWRALRPFEYLKSKAVKRKWEVELKRLDREIEAGVLAGEDLKLRIFQVQDGVERLEASLVALEQDVDVGQSGVAQADEMLSSIRTAIDGRCNLIVKLLKVGNMDVDMPSAENEIYSESLANSLEALSEQHPISRGDRSWSFPSPIRRGLRSVAS